MTTASNDNSAKKVTWIDDRREPQCAADPAYPDGIDLDISRGAERRCRTALPYPAKRCGVYVIECTMCDRRDVVSTAGRADDPKSLTVACRRQPA